MKIRTVNDYVNILLTLYPSVSKSDILKIIKFGWRLYYLVNSYGGDFSSLDDSGFWTYTGYLTKDSLMHCKRYLNKLVLKLRIMYKRKKIPWDGFYYFALTDEQWDNFQALKHKRGRPRKLFYYGTVSLYKLLDECKLRNFKCRYIFKVPFITENGYKRTIDDFKSETALLIITKEPQKFKDILVQEQKYDILNE